MNFNTTMETIKAKLKEYADCVDAFASLYRQELNDFEKKLEGMKGTYTDDYIQQTRANWKPHTDFVLEMSAKREEARNDIQFYLDYIENQMNRFYGGSLSMEIANKLTTAKALDIRLTEGELRILQKQARTHFDNKIISAYAAEVGYSISELPDMDRGMNAYKAFKSACKDCLDLYAGRGAELYDFVKINPIYAQDRVTGKAVCLSAGRILKDSSSDAKGLADVMTKIENVANIGTKVELTDMDKAFINAILPESDFQKYPRLAKERAIEIARSNADVAALLMLDSRYGEEVTKALAGE